MGLYSINLFGVHIQVCDYDQGFSLLLVSNDVILSRMDILYPYSYPLSKHGMSSNTNTTSV
jgi:hypothetical protein